MSASEDGFMYGVPLTVSDAEQIEDAAGEYAYTHERVPADEVRASMEACGYDTTELDAATVQNHLLDETGGAGAGGLFVERYEVPDRHVRRPDPDTIEKFSIVYVPNGRTREDLHTYPMLDPEHRVETAEPSYTSKIAAQGKATAATVRTVVASFF